MWLYINLFISLHSQLQWEQYVDHYCRDFPCLFTKPKATDGHAPMDEGEVIVGHLLSVGCACNHTLLTYR